LQTFVTDYRDACIWLEDFRSKPLPPHMEHKFQLEFERLVVLDYIVRNTDRGSENWLIHCTRPAEHPEEEGKEEVRRRETAACVWGDRGCGVIPQGSGVALLNEGEGV